MIVFPNCKINLGLNVAGKRDDGYHNLETCFYPIDFKEPLEIIQSKDNTVSIRTTGLTLDSVPQQNLCIKAYQLLLKDFPGISALQFHLHKVIPSGAGLGGGSADASFTLKAINDKLKLNISEERLLGYALQLGSDCPFFIKNIPCIASGRGEVLSPVEIDLSAYDIYVVCPNLHVSTKEAFASIVPKKAAKSIQEIIKQPVSSWKNELINDFEDGIFKLHPDLAAIKNQLYNSGAIYASMSGSGSSVYALYEKGNTNRPVLSSDYIVWRSVSKTK